MCVLCIALIGRECSRNDDIIQKDDRRHDVLIKKLKEKDERINRLQEFKDSAIKILEQRSIDRERTWNNIINDTSNKRANDALRRLIKGWDNDTTH